MRRSARKGLIEDTADTAKILAAKAPNGDGIVTLRATTDAETQALINDIKKIKGDILLLGAGGKMGPALALLASQAVAKAGVQKKVMAASRFSEPGVRDRLEANGIKTYSIDLLEDEQLESLPQVDNVLYLAGQKFGTTGKEWFTWSMNTYLPGRVGEYF